MFAGMLVPYAIRLLCSQLSFGYPQANEKTESGRGGLFSKWRPTPITRPPLKGRAYFRVESLVRPLLVGGMGKSTGSVVQMSG